MKPRSASRFLPSSLAMFAAFAFALTLGSAHAQTEDQPKLDVPYVPTPMEVVNKMLDMAQVKEGDRKSVV